MQYEVAWVEIDGDPRRVYIGNFYGDARAAAISSDEQWCVMVGCGFIAYRLEQPWRPYGHDPRSQQWWECQWVRELRLGERLVLPTMSAQGDTFWLSTVSAIPRTHKFVLTARGRVGDWVAREYVVDADSRELELRREVGRRRN